jgi:cytochrome P450
MDLDYAVASCEPDGTSRGRLPATSGSLLDFVRDPVACMRQLYRAHGEIAALDDQGSRLLFVFGPRYNQEVLSDSVRFHARFFSIRGAKISAQRRLTHALLTMNGDEHKRHRRVVMGPFSKQAVGGYRDGLAALAQQMVDEWRPGEVRDILDDMTKYMLRVTSSILFGYDLPELAYDIGDHLDRWVAMNHQVGIGALISDREITDSYADLLGLADELERKVRAMIDYRRSARALGTDVLSLLIRARDAGDSELTDDDLIGQAAVLFGAAHLTTAYSLTWTLFLLAQHPPVAEALSEELSRALGGAAPTLGQLEQLPLLEQVLKESMRVLPASSYSQRVNAQPLELGPFSLPKGTPIIFSQFITHHMAHLYPEPERFLPERWRNLTPSPYAYLPFGAGPRMCLGTSLALMTMKIALPVILQRFRLQVVPGAEINAKVVSTMLTPTNGMRMLLRERNAAWSASPVRGNIHELVTLG